VAFNVASGVADPGSGGFFAPGSQIHIFYSLVASFWVKSTIILSEFAQIPSSFDAVVGFGIHERKMPESGIRDEHPGSATLVARLLDKIN
jgi:hypothetical protein